VKLLIPSMVLVLGTDSIPVPVDRRCRLPSMAEIARQSSAKYVSANPFRHLNVSDARTFYKILTQSYVYRSCMINHGSNPIHNVTVRIHTKYQITIVKCDSFNT